MAPLSYYWLISFIYLVIVKIEISVFLVINLINRIVTCHEISASHMIFSTEIPHLERIYRCTSLTEAKKRYVYMVQSGIMNYKR